MANATIEFREGVVELFEFLEVNFVVLYYAFRNYFGRCNVTIVRGATNNAYSNIG